jgi:LysR family transcriptional activator of nhaA
VYYFIRMIVFFMPAVIEDEICQNFGAEFIGQTEPAKHTFYVISAERKARHSAAQAICDTAKTPIFF